MTGEVNTTRAGALGVKVIHKGAFASGTPDIPSRILKNLIILWTVFEDTITTLSLLSRLINVLVLSAATIPRTVALTEVGLCKFNFHCFRR
jgi:hypothetical protein